MRIVFACGSGGPNYPWSDKTADCGIGGSEESLILLARELVKLGNEVTVYNNCGDQEGTHNGVVYRSYIYYDNLIETDVLVAWRSWRLLQNKQAKHKWVWCHDIPVAHHCPNIGEIAQGALDNIDAFICLNGYHGQLYHKAGIPQDKIIIATVGFDAKSYDKTLSEVGNSIREPARVLYFSHPDRGLDRLRAVWPEVKASVPEATLASFWWEPEHFRPENRALGILPMKALGYRDILIQTFKAGIFGYPSVFAPEINPITTVKAQAGGAIPIVVIQGGMVETVQFGVRTSQGMFAQELISALKMSLAGDLEDERKKMMAWAREAYSWESIAKRWEAAW